MKVIIGLGNPGIKYEKTRHNAGFLAVKRIKENFGFPDFERNKKFSATVSKGEIHGQEVLLVMPEAFMNNSGASVRSIMDFLKLSPEDIIVIHDDLDIPLGKFKVATDSSSAGHNGVRDIIEKLGTQKFKRIRIGIGQEKDGALVCRLDASDFVLQKFTDEELEKIQKTIEGALEKLSELL